MRIKKIVALVFVVGVNMSELVSENIQRHQPTESNVLQNHKPHPKYRNIIFDLGRVLIEWNPEQIVRTLFAQEIKYLPEIIKMPEWLEYDRGTYTNEQMANKICKLNPNIDQETFRIFLDQHQNHMSTIPTGLDMFAMAKQCGYRIYILSNMSMPVFNTLAAKYDFFKQVDGMVISGGVKQVKPEPAIYQTLLNNYHLQPEECLFLDDKQENIDAGKALGIDGVLCLDHAEALKNLHELGVFQALPTKTFHAEKISEATR